MMNINGHARGYMARNLKGEKFLKYVAGVIELQLKEWNENYEVYVMKLKDYEIVIRNEDQYYHVTLSEVELDSLQKCGPYRLDRKVWNELEKQELPIIKGPGNYIQTVL